MKIISWIQATRGSPLSFPLPMAICMIPLTRIGLSRIIEKHLDSIGVRVKGASCKLLRDSCGTILYQKYHDIGLVGKVLRHRNINYTEKYRTAGREVRRFTTGLLD